MTYAAGEKHHKFKHGLSRTPEYRTWRGMIARCSDPNATHYDKYGGRGITVCARWRDFLNFLEDMGPRPSMAYTLDRIEPNGDYEPANCRWATKFVQQQNRRDTKITSSDVVEIRKLRSQGMTQREIGERFGIAPNTVSGICAGKTWHNVL